MPIPLAIPIALAAGGQIMNMVQRGKANNTLRDALRNMPKAPRMTGLAQTLLNAKMPGAANLEAQLNKTYASQIANMQRSATSGNQLILGGAGASGQLNQGYNQLQQLDAQDYERRLQYLNTSQQQDFTNSLQEFQNKLGIQGTINQNQSNNWSDLGNLGMAGLNFATSKPSMFGKGLFGRNPTTTATTTTTTD
jgi:hypothetical protein